MKFSVFTKGLLSERSKGLCEYCGLGVSDPQYHHRRPRGMGGTKRADSGGPENAVVVHPACHVLIESNRNASLRDGFLVWQHKSPADSPILISGRWLLLNRDGSTTVYLRG